jgi:HD-GYP domain-containing protein (c-di-GMP phosphodiesterase class II)
MQLHDLGKLGIPSGIMDKPGRLRKEETAVIRSHPLLPLQFIDTIPFLRHISPVVRHHHERFDGTGYPDRLKGREIPIGSRIIGVADAIDAMTSDRAYRNALDADKVIDELRRLSGIQFDPDVAGAALDILSDMKFHPALQMK